MISSTESFEHVVALNREDVMMAVSRFGHPDLRNSQTTATAPSKEENRAKKPVGGVPVLLGIGNISPVNTPPQVKLRTASEPLTPTSVVLEEDDEDDYATIPENEYITMIPVPAPAPVVVMNNYSSFHQKTTSQLPLIPRKYSAPERLHFATLAVTKSKHRTCEVPVPAPRSASAIRRITVGSKQSIMTQDQQYNDCSHLDNRLFAQETVRVSENPRSRSPLTNLVNGKSHSVPNLLAAIDEDLSNAPNQSSIRSLHNTAYSSEDLYQEIQDTLSLDSPLLHRVSSTFHSVDDTYSSGSECSSTLGSTGDLTTQPQNRKKVFINIITSFVVIWLASCYRGSHVMLLSCWVNFTVPVLIVEFFRETVQQKEEISKVGINLISYDLFTLFNLRGNRRPYVAASEFTFGKPVNGQVDPLSHRELAGYLPGISELKANGMLQGQPRGSYLIFTGYSR